MDFACVLHDACANTVRHVLTLYRLNHVHVKDVQKDSYIGLGRLEYLQHLLNSAAQWSAIL